MSAGEPPTPDEMAQQFPITPLEAQAIADSLTPFQNFAGIGNSIGRTMGDLPGPGPKLVGAVLRNISTHADLTAQSFETIARAIDFYVQAQGGAVEDLFPPPNQIAQELEQQSRTVTETVASFGNERQF